MLTDRSVSLLELLLWLLHIHASCVFIFCFLSHLPFIFSLCVYSMFSPSYITLHKLELQSRCCGLPVRLIMTPSFVVGHLQCLGHGLPFFCVWVFVPVRADLQ